MSAHPYRTAPVVTERHRPWWRRALCAIGSHSRYLVQTESEDLAVCEHCGASQNMFAMSVVEYLNALMHERTDKRWIRRGHTNSTALNERTEAKR